MKEDIIKEYYKTLIIETRENLVAALTADGLSREAVQEIIDKTQQESMTSVREVLEGEKSADSTLMQDLKFRFDRKPKTFRKSFSELAYKLTHKFPQNLICTRISNNINRNKATWYEMGSDLTIGKLLNFLCFEGFKTRSDALNNLTLKEILYIDFDLANLTAEEKNELVTFLLEKKEQLADEQLTIAEKDFINLKEYKRHFANVAELVQYDTNERVMKRISDLLGEIQSGAER